MSETATTDRYDDLVDWITRADENLSPGEVTLPGGRVIAYDGDPYGQRVLMMVKRVLWLHTSIPGDKWAPLRCNACIAGYDPQTGDLVHAAWPCQTIETLLLVDRSAEPSP